MWRRGYILLSCEYVGVKLLHFNAIFSYKTSRHNGFLLYIVQSLLNSERQDKTTGSSKVTKYNNSNVAYLCREVMRASE